MKNLRFVFVKSFGLVPLLFFLAGCGGGGGSSSTTSPTGSSGSSLLQDVNGDGQVKILAFGDSITAGYEDDESEDGLSGFPLRLKNILNVPVAAKAIGGEDLVGPGLTRLIGLLSDSSADLLLLDEGSSDALDGISPSKFSDALQDAVTRIKASNKIPLLINQYPTCCDFGTGVQSKLDSVNDIIRNVGALNNVRVADLDRAWKSTCDTLPDCYLTHKPDGIHPNHQGYDAITQVILASLADIDIFAPNGAAMVEQAYGLPAGTVFIKPDES